MAINRRTLRLIRRLMVAVGEETDSAVRQITESWVRAWDELSGQWRTLVGDLVAASAVAGRWPTPWQLARLDRLASATFAAEQALTQLSTQAGVTITSGATGIVGATAAAEPAIIASQLPAALASTVQADVAATILPSALNEIVARTAEQITSTTRPLSREATEAMKRALIKGIAVGGNPVATARDMVARVAGAFNGGLDRAIVVARTECLDAYRRTSEHVHRANDDILQGWRWHSDLSSRTCVACRVLHGTVFPTSSPGPLGHPQCRCGRIPAVKPWRDLGIDIAEPEDATVDSYAQWLAMPPVEQDAVLGRRRAEFVRAGDVAWTDLVTRRDNPGWRASYVPTSVRQLERIAARRRAA